MKASVDERSASTSTVDKLRERLAHFPVPLWLLALANFVLFTSRGMTIPFLVIFFGQILGLGEGLVGFGLAVNAVSGVIFTLMFAGTIDRFGARPVLIAMIFGTAVTTALFPLGTTPTLFFGIMILQGCFTQLYWPSSDALATSLVPVSRAGEMFALLRVANAIGIGAGGLIGGLMVSGGGEAQYRLLYVTAGAGVAAAGVMVLALVRPRRASGAGAAHQGDSMKAGSWREVLADRRFLYSQVVMFLLIAAFMQLQVSAPPYLRAEAGIAEAAIGLLFTINTLIVVVAQIWVARRIGGWGRGMTLALAALVWAASYLIIGASPWWTLLPFVAIVVYTFGEMLFMPTTGVVVVELAPERLRGRYLAFSSIVWGSAYGLASWAAGTVLASERPALLWPGLAVVLLIGALCAWFYDRLPARQIAGVPAESVNTD